MRELYRKVTLPLLSISLTDDEYMSESNVKVLHGFYENARREMRRIAPAQLGVSRIGHFGFFRAEVAEPIWQSMFDWLVAAIRQ